MSPLVIGAIGVVFGDIGTSPLYTLRQCFGGEHHLVTLTPANVLGILSIIFWALMIIVTVKYVWLIMRADNRGEGGILALTALVSRGLGNRGRRRWWLGRASASSARHVLRRRDDHAGDLGAGRGRGARDHRARSCIRSSFR
jgi:K+ transporter